MHVEPTIHHIGRGTILGSQGPMMVGVISPDAADPEEIEHPLALIDLLLERHPAIAVMLVIEQGARSPDPIERRRMQEVLARHGDRLLVGFATCGLGFWMRALRAVLVGVSRMVGAPIIAHTTIEATARHLARELVGIDPDRMIVLAELLRARLRDGCMHARLLVDHRDLRGTVETAALERLRATPADDRARITLHAPRCDACGASLTRAQLGARVEPGGDLHDPRFVWPWTRV